MSALFELSGVTQAYRGRTVLALDRLVIEERIVTGVRGENGSGKSTLLRILALLEDPVSGRVLFQGRPVSSRDRAARLQVTLLGQEPYLLKRSVLANVEYGLKARGMTKHEAGARAREALEMVGLDPGEYGPRPWYALSGGEAQRTALACRLALRPRVLLLDEPFNNLDADSALLITRAALTARDLWSATLVVVSHDGNWLDNSCDRIVSLRCGRQADPPARSKESPCAPDCVSSAPASSC